MDFPRHFPVNNISQVLKSKSVIYGIMYYFQESWTTTVFFFGLFHENNIFFIQISSKLLVSRSSPPNTLQNLTPLYLKRYPLSKALPIFPPQRAFTSFFFSKKTDFFATHLNNNTYIYICSYTLREYELFIHVYIPSALNPIYHIHGRCPNLFPGLIHSINSQAFPGSQPKHLSTFEGWCRSFWMNKKLGRGFYLWNKQF